MWLLLLLLSLFSTCAQTCGIPGFCQGTQLDFSVTDTFEQCRGFCQDTKGCQWYTHDSSNDYCIAFADCPEIDETCITCLSGQSTCQPPQCFVPGKCQGKLISFSDALSQEDCLKKCQDTDDCFWFTYHMTDHFCSLLEDCELNSADEYSVSGERNCTVEYADLPDYPLDIIGAVGTVIDGQIGLCGGHASENITEVTSSCFRLNREFNIWMEFESMPEPICRAAATVTNKGWWITGGRSSGPLLSSSILYNSTSETWSQGPALPSPRDVHCIVQINQALSVLIGGYSLLNDTWIYSWPDDHWTEAPDMPSPMYDMACHLYTDQDGVKHILVAGGNAEPDTIVLSLNLDSMTWSRLSDLPSRASSWPAFVQDGENIILVNPLHNNMMLFNEDDMTFSNITGQGTGVNGYLPVVIPIVDENLHGCY